MSDDIPTSDEPEFPWPQKGDQLFKADDNDWWLNATIDHWNKDVDSYAEGYKRAADIIIEHVKTIHSENRIPLDYLVFPVVFLYRHYIELRLKEIILLGRKLDGSRAGPPKHHRIDELWKLARAIVESDSAEKEDLSIVEACIGEFAHIDPSSESFRYPRDKAGKTSISSEQLHINVRHLQETAARLASFLDGCTEYLYIQWQQLPEE